MTKAHIRNQIRLMKKSLSGEQIALSGKEVLAKLQNFPPFLEADIIYCYASYNQELPTTGIMEYAFKRGKTVALPKVEGENIRFYVITDLSQITSGYQGILEPITDKLLTPTKKTPGLMLLPGLAFSHSGERLGYGGGFYDRYLSAVQERALITCGLGYDFQIREVIPVEENDRSIDYLITPSKVVKCAHTKVAVTS